MKQMLRGYVSLCALFSVIGFVGTVAATDVRIRGQSVDTARELAGWTNHVNLYDMGGIYGTFAITPEYTQSFDDRQIARSLFGSAIERAFTTTDTDTFGTFGNCNKRKKCNKECASFRVSGSQAADRQAGDLLADYFGLPLDYQSTVKVCPNIINFLVDFDLFVGLDEWLCGLWFRIHAPVVWARWKLRMDEDQSVTPVAGYPAGYFGPNAVPVSALNTSFMSYLQGNVPNLGAGAVFQPLTASNYYGDDKNCNRVCTSPINNDCTTRFCKTSDTTLKLSDIRAALGWNFWQDEDYHVGAGVLLSAPTGNRVDDRLLFQPFVGNGHHWELGGKFTSHYTFWRSCDYDRNFGFYFDLDVTTMFATRQFRTFDLCGAGDNSKYMLAEQMNSSVADLTADVDGVFSVPSSQFNTIFTPVASLASLDITNPDGIQSNATVYQPVQVDLTAMFNYTHCGFAFDLGYNFWYTSAERIKTCEKRICSVTPGYALKGDANTFGFTTDAAGLAVPLSATESKATICSGTNMILTSPLVTATTSFNQRVDNPYLAYNAAGADPLVNSIDVQDYTSYDPVLLTKESIDFEGARCRGLSNRVFGHFSYTWEDCDCYVPYFGVGASGEFVGRNKKRCDETPCSNSSGCGVTSPTCCPTRCDFDNDRNNDRNNKDRNSRVKITNISQWGVWLKGGFSFN